MYGPGIDFTHRLRPNFDPKNPYYIDADEETGEYDFSQVRGFIMGLQRLENKITEQLIVKIASLKDPWTVELHLMSQKKIDRILLSTKDDIFEFTAVRIVTGSSDKVCVLYGSERTISHLKEYLMVINYDGEEKIRQINYHKNARLVGFEENEEDLLAVFYISL